MASTEQSGEVPGVNVSDSQGILIGSGNQYNTWAQKPPFDPVAMRDVDPNVAVAQLQQLPHDELVYFFARAKPEDVSEILVVFLEVDRAKIVAALGDIRRPKVTELTRAIGAQVLPGLIGISESSALQALPEAAQEITRKAVSLRWTNARPLEWVSGGYSRRYKDGCVFWSDDFGVRTTAGLVDIYVIGASECGVAIGDQEAAPTSPYGTEGIRQKFQGGTVYSSKHGTFRVVDIKCYENEGGSGGWLGFPIGETQASRDFGQLQQFEDGTICSYFEERREHVFTVRREIACALPDRTWHAVSKEVPVVSSSGTQGTVQRFKVKLELCTYGTAVYSPERRLGPVTVRREIWDYYSKLGVEKSWLGFPMTRGLMSGPGAGAQDFEGGVIYWQSGSDPIAVRKAVDDFITQRDDLPKQLGFPVTEEQPMGTDESDRIQFFKGGAVTLRDGEYEVWLRPDPDRQ